MILAEFFGVEDVGEVKRTGGLTSTGQILVMAIEMIALSLPAAIVGAVSGGFLGRFVASSATSTTSMAPLQEDILSGTVIAMVVGSVLCALIVLANKRRRVV